MHTAELSDKELVGYAVAERILPGEIIAVGTGSTVDAAIVAIGKRIESENLEVQAIVTSYESAWRCSEVGITVLSNDVHLDPVWGFDGADAVDPALRVIKGRGGALLREKLTACRCGRLILAVDESKLVEDLAASMSVPIEVIPEARWHVERELKHLDARTIKLRQGSGKHGPTVTEYGNIILDVNFGALPHGVEGELKKITGVVESGLFENQAAEVMISGGGKVRLLTR